LKYTSDLINWNDYKGGEEMDGNTDKTNIVKIQLEKFEAKAVRLIVGKYVSYPVLRFKLLGLKDD